MRKGIQAERRTESAAQKPKGDKGRKMESLCEERKRKKEGTR